jgi:hypothetical protein
MPNTMLKMIPLALLVLALNAALPGRVSAQSVAENVKRAQDRWMQCLQSSFRINRRQQPDPNAAPRAGAGEFSGQSGLLDAA